MPDEVAADGETVPFPPGAEYLDYEGEAAIVFGKRGKAIKADHIDEYVWWISLLNDWSIRDRRAAPPVTEVGYNLAKNFERSTSLGPCIVVGELQAQNVAIQTRINSELRQDYNTSEMIWGFGELAEYVSKTIPFVPGDLFAGGTSVGTAADLTAVRFPNANPRPKDFFLRVGDSVEVSSPQIGSVTNHVVAG